MIAVETLYLTALLSAFIGWIALLSLARPRGAASDHSLVNFIVIAAVISLGSFLLYAQSPRESARLVYGAALARPANL